MSTTGPPAARPRPSPLSAGGWSGASFLISQAVGSLLYLPLARLLTPADFGLITEAALVSTGLTLVGELSLTRGLVRLDGDRDRLAQATLRLSLLVGLIGALLCALAGLPMAAIFGDQRLRLLLLMLAPAVLATALGTVPHALLARELDFRRKTLPETVSIGCGGLAALGAALLGAGVYSLVLYTVIRTTLSSAVAWRVVGWRPPAGQRPDRTVMRRILGYGLPASGGDLALYARLNTDYAVTGRRLGTDALGVYTLAWNAAASPAAILSSAFGGVGFATFSRLQQDRPRLRAVYFSATRLIAALAFPLFASAVFIREELVEVAYGARWGGMVAPLLPLFLLQGVREVCRPGASLTLALGYSRLYALCGALMLPLTLTAVLIGSRSGITGVAWAMLAAVGGASLVWPAIAIALLRPSPVLLARTFGLPLLLALAAAPAVAGTNMLLTGMELPAALRLILSILAGLLTFLAVARLCWSALRRDLACLRVALPDHGALEPSPPLASPHSADPEAPVAPLALPAMER